MAKKYYAIRKGRETGIVKTWDECKELTHGYEGAEFKGFLTLKEATDYMKGKDPEVITPKDGWAIAYVDGSYRADTETFSYGAVLFYDGQDYEFSGAYYNPDVNEMRNVAGELKGAMEMMNYCVKNGIKNLEIHHDYEGIAKWCLGEWKTNKAGTKMYKQYCDKVRDELFVTFVKVKGHSGDINNDRADRLAKMALGIE